MTDECECTDEACWECAKAKCYLCEGEEVDVFPGCSSCGKPVCISCASDNNICFPCVADDSAVAMQHLLNSDSGDLECTVIEMILKDRDSPRHEVAKLTEKLYEYNKWAKTALSILQ